MWFTDVDGRKVVSTSTAETVGKVDEFVIDPASGSVVALRLKKTDSGDTLTWGNITAVGTDAVTVTDASVITEPDENVALLGHKDKRALGKRVLNTAGDELGKLADVDFDPASGAVTALRIGDSEVPGDRLLGIGSYAVVVRTG